jgi:hypothetical protein
LREQFNSLGDIFGYYRFLKYKLESCRSNFPDEEKLKALVRRSNSIHAKSSKEESLSFIGDVESFVKFYRDKMNNYVLVPLDCLHLIFLQKFCPDLSKFKSYGHLALHFHKRIMKGETLPRRLKYRQHLYNEGNLMKEKAEIYFTEKGYLVPETVEEK